jgi:hypothetical protein
MFILLHCLMSAFLCTFTCVAINLADSIIAVRLLLPYCSSCHFRCLCRLNVVYGVTYCTDDVAITDIDISTGVVGT